MSPRSWDEFDPPEHGLNDGEVVEWSQRAGVNFLLFWCAGCLPLLTFFMSFFIISWFGERIGSVILLVIGLTILYLIYLAVQQKRTSLYVTNQRILKVRGGLVQSEIQIDNLRDRSSDEFIKASESHNEGAYTFYNITITDHVSGAIIDVSAMREDILEKLKKIGKTLPS